MEVFRNLPHDIIHEILDYFNYAKYCKPEHKEAFSTTLSNINDFFTTGIKPIIVKKCLGKVNCIESWGIATTRHHVEELLQPYWEMITLRNKYCNELKLSTEHDAIRKQREKETWKEKRKRLIKNKLDRMLQKRLP
jgi:hypothetical protein